jgi:hypothetical protein
MKTKKSLSGNLFVPGKPKKTHQGQGLRSLPKPGKKLSRGQGK